MAVSNYTTFKGITNVEHDSINENLLHGVMRWLQWASLEIGAYQNVTMTQDDGLYGGHPSRLRMESNPNYTDGQVWSGYRADWVWESGVSFSPQPIVASGVSVDNVFYPTDSTTGTYAHHIDYPGGKVIFDNAIPTTSVVKTNFAHRTASFVNTNTRWFQELMFDSYKYNRADFLAADSGNYSQFARTRRQLPAIGLEIAGRRGFAPYQLGGGQWIYQDMLMYIFAEDDRTKNQWSDILSTQNDITIWLPSIKLMKEHEDYPLDLDYRGMPINDRWQFPRLVNGDSPFRWGCVSMSNTNVQDMEPVNNFLYRSVVRTTFLMAMTNI